MKKLSALLVMALLPVTSFANLSCIGTVSDVLVYADGTVGIKQSETGDFTFICNLKEERLGVSTATCALWTSLLINVKENRSKAEIFYRVTGTTCRDLPLYANSPAPWYIGDVTKP
jgi:hypothetical protein